MTLPLLGVSWRALKRGPLLLSVVSAVILTGATTAVVDEGYAVQVLRGVALLLAGGLVVVLDDPAADVLAASPTPLARRWLARLMPAITLAAGAWALAVAWVGAVAGALPWQALTVEAAGLGSCAVALAAALRRWRDVREPGPLAATALFGAVVAAYPLPPRWSLFVGDPSWPGWTAAHLRWATVLALGLLVVVLAGQDPARQGVIARTRHRTPGREAAPRVRP